MVDSEREPITFVVKPSICLAFRKKCLDNDIQYSDAIAALMEEYANRN